MPGLKRILLLCAVLMSATPAAHAAEPGPDELAALAKAQEDFDASRYADALAKLQALEKRRPDWAQVSRMLGHTLYEMDRLDEARAALGRAMSQGQLSPDVLARSVQIDRRMGRVVASEAAVRMLVVVEPDQPQWRQLLAETLIEQARLDEAAAVYRDMITREPADAQLRLRLGQIRLQQGNAGPALQSLEAAHRLGARSPNLGRQIGELHAQSGDPANAIAWLQREPAYSSDASLRLRTAQLYLELHEDDEAQKLAQPFATDTHAPHALAANHILARAALRGTSPDAAMPFLTKIAGLGPADPSLLEAVAYHHFNRGAFAKAAELLGRRIALAPAPDRRVLQTHTRALIESNQRDAARATLRRYLAGFPLDADARDLLRRLAD